MAFVGAGLLVRSLARAAQVEPGMVALVDDMKHRYESRILVFDLPPVLTNADVLAFAPLLDAVLLVVGEGHSRRHDIEESIHRLKGAVPILGTVLNQVGCGAGEGRSRPAAAV